MEQIAVSVRDAAKMLSIGRTATYVLINSGRLKTVKIGDRRLCSVESIRALVNNDF